MVLSKRFEDAVLYGIRIHGEQTRKGTSIPYVAHLMAVTGIVLENGGTEDEAIAAFLHDAAEDQGGKETLDEIKRMFGDSVAATVASCTDAWTIPKPPWRQRKEAYIKHIASANHSALLVSLADKLHNARAILNDYQCLGDELWERFNASKGELLWYYRGLADAFAQTNFKLGLITEFNNVVSRLEEATRQR